MKKEVFRFGTWFFQTHCNSLLLCWGKYEKSFFVQNHVIFHDVKFFVKLFFFVHVFFIFFEKLEIQNLLGK